jgi:hypothetical protein
VSERGTAVERPWLRAGCCPCVEEGVNRASSSETVWCRWCSFWVASSGVARVGIPVPCPVWPVSTRPRVATPLSLSLSLTPVSLTGAARRGGVAHGAGGGGGGAGGGRAVHGGAGHLARVRGSSLHPSLHPPLSLSLSLSHTHTHTHFFLTPPHCTAPSLIPTVNGNTVRSFSTHGQQSAAQGSSTTVLTL